MRKNQVNKQVTRYELPQGGISLLGYIVRRMHKTSWLAPVQSYLAQGNSAEALLHVAIYTAISSTSYGEALYQPKFNAEGDEVSERDSVTDAIVTARLDSRSPHYKISYEVELPNRDLFQGQETITGTKIGFRGLGMPAPSRFSFVSGEYTAELNGVITSELALSLVRQTHIRAYGHIEFSDNDGNTGRLVLDRSGKIMINLNGEEMEYHISRLINPENIVTM